MGLKYRFIPPDAREDAKFFKKLPYESLYWIIGSLVLGLIIWLKFRLSPLLGIAAVLLPPIFLIIIFIYNIPSEITKRLSLRFAVLRYKKLENMSCIKKYDSISETKNGRQQIYLENTVYPWEVCPSSNKDRLADTFAQNIMKTVRNNTFVSIYGITGPENTAMLEEKLKKLSTLPDKLQELQSKRIEHHYYISRSAEATKYYTGISIRKNSDEDIIELADKMGEDTQIIGGDYFKELVETHLTMGAKSQRGKDGKSKNSDEQVEKKNRSYFNLNKLQKYLNTWKRNKSLEDDSLINDNQTIDSEIKNSNGISNQPSQSLKQKRGKRSIN